MGCWELNLSNPHARQTLSAVQLLEPQWDFFFLIGLFGLVFFIFCCCFQYKVSGFVCLFFNCFQLDGCKNGFSLMGSWG